MLIRAIITLIVLVAALSGYSRAEAGGAEALLDGLVFVGHNGPRGKSLDGNDEIIFRNGRFRSVSCNNWEFDSAVYSATQEDDGVHFQAVTTSPKYGQIKWQGVVKGELIEVTYLWTMRRWYWFDAHEERWFQGRLKRE